MSFSEFSESIGLAAIVSGLITLVVTRLLNYRDSKKGKLELISLKLKDIENWKNDVDAKLDNVQDDLLSINSLVDVLIEALQSILRDRIIQIYNVYANDKKYFPIYARESVNRMYNAYKKFGDDEVISDLVYRLNKLPVEKSEKE